jgi:CheY-like chemotaxis protein
VAVPDGEEALAFLRYEGEHVEAERPDLVLLDLNLPRKNGLEVLEEINRFWLEVAQPPPR